MINKKHYYKICTKCNGLVTIPNAGYVYSGTFCHCEEPETIDSKYSGFKMNELDDKTEEAMRVLKEAGYKIVRD